MYKTPYLLLYFVVNILGSNSAARILAVYPSPALSHQVLFRPLTQELLHRGHEVVVATTKPVFPKGQTPNNLIEIDVSNSREILQGYIVAQIGRKNNQRAQTQIIYENALSLFKINLQNNEIHKLITNKTVDFDIMLVDAISRPTLALSHVFKVPVIQVSSIGRDVSINRIVGAADHPLLYPTAYSEKMNIYSLWEKVAEIYNYYLSKNLLTRHENFENEIIQGLLGPETPAITELHSSVNAILINSHPIFEGNYPVPPSLVHIWGMHQIPEKKLPEELVSYLDNSMHGVIYISFGSTLNPSYLMPEVIQTLVNVFSKLSYNVLWKWDKDELPGQSRNIKIDKWFPQSDLLKHPKIKLFITQGGLQSIDEAISAGVPLICIPALFDQWYNAEKIEYLNIGVQLDMLSMTEEQLLNAINTVIVNESYRSNVLRLNRLLRDQPQSALRRAADCVERAMRRGTARHMRAPAANMAAAEYFMLDIIIPVVVIVIIVFIFICKLIYFITRLIFNICNVEIISKVH